MVRNGCLPERAILTALGPILVKQPSVRDRSAPGDREKFRSSILPPYLRKSNSKSNSKSMEELLPWLYLKGISTSDFGEAPEALLGPCDFEQTRPKAAAPKRPP